MDFVLFSNYGRQVDALLAGHHRHRLEHQPGLGAHRRARPTGQCRALAMRDTDTVFQTIFVARPGTGLERAGRTCRVAGWRSAPRTPRRRRSCRCTTCSRPASADDDVDLLRINSDVGKHGDTGRSELDALRAVLDDRADAAALGINTWEAIGREELMPGAFEAFWEPRRLQPLQLHRAAHAARRAVRAVGGAAARDGLGQPRAPAHPGDGGSAAVGAARSWTATTRCSRRSRSRGSRRDGEPRRCCWTWSRRVGAAPRRDLVTVPRPAGRTTLGEAPSAWWPPGATATGNELVEVRDGSVAVRRGPAAPIRWPRWPRTSCPGTRLWIYTNFDCNLACDYCCVRVLAAGRPPRRSGLDRVRRLAAEAVDAGVSELILTGGEPFLLPDIDEVVAACTAALPTTLLTNGMLFHGPAARGRCGGWTGPGSPCRSAWTPRRREVHDQHRGQGSWAPGGGRHPDRARATASGSGSPPPSPARAGARARAVPRVPRRPRHRPRGPGHPGGGAPGVAERGPGADRRVAGPRGHHHRRRRLLAPGDAPATTTSSSPARCSRSRTPSTRCAAGSSSCAPRPTPPPSGSPAPDRLTPTGLGRPSCLGADISARRCGTAPAAGRWPRPHRS